MCLTTSDAAHLLFGIEVDGDNEAVETQDLGENENEDHSDEESGLLRGSANACVSHNSDRVAGGKTGEADGEAGAEVDESPKRERG